MTNPISLVEYIENKLETPAEIMEKVMEGFKLLREEQKAPPKLEE